MKTQKALSIVDLTKSVIKFAKKQYIEKDLDQFLKFIKLYYSKASINDLGERPISNLYGLVLSHWKLAARRRSGHLKLALFNPLCDQDGWESSHTILQVMTNDAPFLVDSIRMEIERFGITAHLMIYMGGMQIKRDASGDILSLDPYTDNPENHKIEAPIYFEIDRIDDATQLQSLLINIERIIDDVNTVVDDWQLMQESMLESIEQLGSYAPKNIDKDEINETSDFLHWLLSDNFTFLGKRDYVVKGKGDDTSLHLISGSGLGVLRNEKSSKSKRFFSELPEKARKQMLSSQGLLIISQTNTYSTVHRAGFTAYIGIKQFDSKSGKLIRERRFIGLYTSRAYSTNPSDVPFLRHKVKQVLAQSGWPEKSHAGKDLVHILTVLPRDDLFQASVDELLKLSLGILHLQDRRLVRLFVREDAYGRYMSCLVYLPRDIFNTRLITKIQAILLKAFDGTSATFTTHLSNSVLAHVHFIVRKDSKKELNYHFADIQQEIVKTAVTWFESFSLNLGRSFNKDQAMSLVQKYRDIFPEGYKEVCTSSDAVEDVCLIESLSQSKTLSIRLSSLIEDSEAVICLKLFHQYKPIALSDALPILENMGFRVISEQSYCLSFEEDPDTWISDFRMTSTGTGAIDIKVIEQLFYDVFEKTYLQKTDNDLLNKLVLLETMNWREILILRVYAKYFQQAGITFSHQYITESLVKNSEIAKLIVQYFEVKFTDSIEKINVNTHFQTVKNDILLKLESVRSLDEDRIVRKFIAAIEATLRTNFFQMDLHGNPKSYVALKFDPTLMPGLPKPLPKLEIFVYSRLVEGVHLRSDNVARGGIRWSDRREDFRTEVLGLMKAQRVKNAIIVPAGAKGGFVAKCLEGCSTREDFYKEGVRCYQLFINGLLDCVDNIVEGEVVTPENTIYYDAQDPYLVVAADKGTATFSDIANEISAQRHFWLNDAFASGGSSGYDHKKMGITAKGAWVSARRSFQELGVNIDEESISVVGIGDMAGDVFGNGMLLSEKIKLVAAFNHLHIFIDPNPDERQSFSERKRLFETPRSNWSDYEKKLISKGGGVFLRSAKSIKLTREMQSLLVVNQDALTPNELITAILSAPVDMIWNGGIGTFIKSSDESNEHVGDRTNNAIRVNASEVRAKVICEGGNLGLTQKARIESDLLGCKVHTDFIDNSAGVDCSDNEVNIKIMLREVMKQGGLALNQRNQLLKKMTSDVESLVLENNYQQNRLIGQIHYAFRKKMNILRYYIAFQEESGYIDRVLEHLPDDHEIQQRNINNIGFTRPEVAVLIAYAKNILKHKLSGSDLISEPFMERFLHASFPTVLSRKFSSYIGQHRLRENIIVNQLCNQVVSDMGVTFVYQLQYETGLPVDMVIRAYLVSSQIFKMTELMAEINQHDFTVSTDVIYQMTDDVIRLIRRAARWMLRNHTSIDLSELIEKYQKPVMKLFGRLSSYILGEDKSNFEDCSSLLESEGVVKATAHRVGLSIAMFHSLNIVSVAESAQAELSFTAKIYFHLVNRLHLIWFREYINHFQTDSQWSVMAVSSYKADLDAAQRCLTKSVVLFPTEFKTIPARMNAWLQKYNNLFERWVAIIEDLRGKKSNDFAIISVAVREIGEIAKVIENYE